MFTSLCAFCARKMGKDFEQPEEFMDPTQLVTKIMELLKELVSTNCKFKVQSSKKSIQFFILTISFVCVEYFHRFSSK